MYLSPAACETFARMFKVYRVKPCEKPAMEEVKLILGKRDMLGMLQD